MSLTISGLPEFGTHNKATQKMLKHLERALEEHSKTGFKGDFSLKLEDEKYLLAIFQFILENQKYFPQTISVLDGIKSFPLWAETKAAFSSEKVTKVSSQLLAPKTKGGSSKPSGVYRPPRVSRRPSPPPNVEEVVLMANLQEDDGNLLVAIGNGTQNNPWRKFLGSKMCPYGPFEELGKWRLGLKVPLDKLPESTPAKPGVSRVLLTWTQDSYTKGFWTFCGGTDKPLTIEKVSVNVECYTEVWKDPRGRKKVTFHPSKSFQYPRGCRIPMYEGKPCLALFQNQVGSFFKGETELMCGITWLNDKSTGKSFASIGAPVEGAPTAKPYCARQSYGNRGGSGYTRRAGSSQAYRAPQGRFNSSGSSARNSDGVYRAPRGRVAKQPRNGSFESSNWRR